MKRILKNIFFISINLLLGKFIWYMLAILNLADIRFFKYLFCIYPGSEENIKEYFPLWLVNTGVFKDTLLICGIIKGEKGGNRGLIVGRLNTTTDFIKDRMMAERVYHRLESARLSIGAKTIALAGQLPGLLLRRGISFNGNLVEGVKGAVFSIVDTIDKAIKKHELKAENLKIALIGIGLIGKATLEYLELGGYNVAGIDVRMTRKNIILSKDASHVLENADIVVVLTPSGDDFMPYIKLLKKGAIVIDDTHPMIKGDFKNLNLYKVAVEADGVCFVPSLTGYKKKWIPGCVVEAMVITGNSYDINVACQEEFNREARASGFSAVLESI